MTHQDQGDPLGDHGAGPEDAEEDQDGGQDVAKTQLERDVEGVGEGRGGQDADRLGGGHHHRGADGQLRGGGEQREDHQGQQEQLTLLGRERRSLLDFIHVVEDLRAAGRGTRATS